MMKKTQVIGVVAIAIIVASLLLSVPQVMARISHMNYSNATYSYDVAVDTVMDPDTKQTHEVGLNVFLSPDRPSKDAAGFSTEYIRVSQERAEIWSKQREGALVDTMLVFARPLTLEEANSLLEKVDASVVESAVVGFSGDIPWAEYTRESGPHLTRTLEEISKLSHGIASEDEAAPAALEDVRGYLAVRAWIPAEQLDDLLAHELVELVDTTPQNVRDELVANPIWQDMEVTSLALEMPVWAYEW